MKPKRYKGYTGVFLPPQSVTILQRIFPPRFEKVRCHHVTIRLAPTAEHMQEIAPYMGARVLIRVDAYCVDERAEAISIDMDSEIRKLVEKAHPHITLSHDPAVGAVYSNKLLEQGPYHHTPYITVGGVVGYTHDGTHILYDIRDLD